MHREHRRTPLALLASLVASLVVSSAHAADVELDLRTEPRVTTRVTRAEPDDDEEVARCVGRCSLRLPEGRYLLHVDGEHVTSKTIEVTAARSTRVFVEPGDARLRGWGSGLMIAGALSTLVGLGGVAESSMGCIQDNCHDGGHSDAETHAWLGVAAIGAAATITGIVLFASGSTDHDVQSMGDGRATMPRASFGVAPIRGGAFGALTVAF